MRDSSSRNAGLDLARNLAIFLVIVQHVAFLGGLGNEGMGLLHRLQARFLEALSQSCVDIFGILSGYLGVRATGWNWRRFCGLWLQVWTTGLLVLGFCALVGGVWPAAFSNALPCADDWLTAACPLMRNEYWYFTGYFCVFLLAPAINRFLFAPGRAHLGFVAAGVLFALVCGTTVFPGGTGWLPLAKGYSATWLVCLYIFGAALRQGEGHLPKIRPGLLFGVAAGGVLLTVGQRVLMASFPAIKELFADEWTLSAYTSPTVVLTAAALLLGCAHLNPKNPDACVWSVNAVLAPGAFGVYLLHVQPFFFDHGFKGTFAFLDRVPDVCFGLAVLGTAVGCCLAFELLECLRLKLAALGVSCLRHGGSRS
ncbi:MAG: acyltransferase [Kiritimatiellae bacterium]|nr:acyltransferase [Kiritimatiellia bacterium]